MHNAICYDQITQSLFHQSIAPYSKMNLACSNVLLHTSRDSVCGVCAEKASSASLSRRASPCAKCAELLNDAQ